VYEEVYLKAYQSVAEARQSLATYFEFTTTSSTRSSVTAPRARYSRSTSYPPNASPTGRRIKAESPYTVTIRVGRKNSFRQT
jgi:hypothetical protein